MNQPRVTIVGSLNMDLIVETATIPSPGETVLGKRFSTAPGGKGNNQAVACARLGAEVTLIGCVGKDSYGAELIQNLQKEGIITDHIITIPSESTGIAFVIVKEEGENLITVVMGANNSLTPEHIAKKEEIIRQSDIVLLQLEVPLETVMKTVEIAESHGIPIVLNPAPSQQLPARLIDKASILTPNEHELAKMFFCKTENSPDWKELVAAFPEKIVMTKGKEGAYFADRDGKLIHIPSYEVNVVDTTGAGDSFNAGLVVKYSQNKNLYEATNFAVAVGALSVTAMGAQGGMPTKEEVEKFLNQQKSK